MTPRRTILVVAPWVPAPTSGFGTRVFQLCVGLARQHSVAVLCHAQAGDDDALAQLADRVDAVHTVAADRLPPWRRRLVQSTSLLSPSPFETRRLVTASFRAALHTLLAEQRFDVVQFESAYLGGLARPGLPSVIDEHNIEHELLSRVAAADALSARKVFHRWDAIRTRRLEQRLWRRVPACAVTSEREQAMVSRWAPQTLTAVVPNGVDADHFRPEPDSAVDPSNLVFVGTMHYQPNVDAAIHFIRDVLPLLWRDRPDLVFTAVGHHPPAELARLAGPRVVITGSVPDVRPYVHRAAVVVVPLRSGSGTRLKILEAMAMGRPVISTRMGMEGLDAQPGRDLLVADGPEQLAALIRRALDDPALRAAVGARGRALVEDRYSWERATSQLEELHCRLLASREHGRRK
jgi:glycosyltransferase involved in cell wall biosynthesis